MAVESYAHLIREALFDPSPTESVFRVKTAVARELAALDSTASIKSTEFFNHTFAPDFVMKWEDRTERNVFLRSTYDLEYLAEDVAELRSETAIVFGLDASENRDFSQIEEALKDSDVMFTEPSALEDLIELKDESGTVRMLNNALAQGGRGLVTRETATALATSVANGFSGAGSLDSGSTGTAASLIEEVFAERQAWRLTRVLQAVWEGSNGKLLDFPGQADLSGKLNKSALQYLISYMDTQDLDFWRRIGRSISLNQLAHLEIRDREEAFNLLVKANLDVLHAGAAALIPDELKVESIERDGMFSWGIRDKHVSLEGPQFFVMLGELKHEVTNYAQGPGVGISANDVIKRSPALSLSEITFESGREGLTYSSQDGELNKERLLGIANQWIKAPLAQTAIAQSPTGRININFKQGLAWRTTSSTVLLSDLLSASLPLLHYLDESETDGLEEFLAHKSETASSTGATLFDEADMTASPNLAEQP